MIGIPVAAGALSFIGITLTPIIASAMMSFSSLFVVSNALRIAKRKNKNIKIGEVSNVKTKTVSLFVDGMMCNHCVSKVQDAINSVKGVYRTDVNLSQKKATAVCDETVAESLIISAIENAGYKIISAEKSK